jgi:SAM-dependent methyltransferase
MTNRFLKMGTTYLPFGFTAYAMERFGVGDPEPIISELSVDTSYERVGIDRALAIAIDLAVRGQRGDARILDVGCSVGTIGRLLSEIGYQVTGIDSDVVAGVQEWQDEGIISTARNGSHGSNFSFVRADLRDFLDSRDEKYDVALLLSVIHHWLSGYGYTGTSQFDREEVGATLLRLCARVRDCIYLEVPIEDEAFEMPPDPLGEFVFPRWFLDSRQATDVTFIASTIATNGKPRRLYRVEMA